MAESRRDLRGTWWQGVYSLVWPLLLVFAFRWAVLEPFVIPSGSMIPTLKVHDHILVNKLGYGLKWPWSDDWLLMWAKPQRGDVVVFKYPPNPDLFYVKRLIGIPGDSIHVRDGRITINGESAKLRATKPSNDEDSSNFSYFQEDLGSVTHLTRFSNDDPAEEDAFKDQEFAVPEGEYFFMGDNRHQSLDSRSWGFVPERFIRGKAWIIWLSCDEMLANASFVCNPATLRPKRLFKRVSSVQ